MQSSVADVGTVEFGGVGGLVWETSSHQGAAGCGDGHGRVDSANKGDDLHDVSWWVDGSCCDHGDAAKQREEDS